jgi:hypothetical protein
MQYLVKTSINALNTQLRNMSDENKKFSIEIKDLISQYPKELNMDSEICLNEKKQLLNSMQNDYSNLSNFADFYLNGDLNQANQIAANFDTYVRELIPTIVWELLGNQLIHEKDKNILPEHLTQVPENVSKILLAYKNDMRDYAQGLEVKFFNKFAKNNKITKDNLLLECLKKLQSQDDTGSKELVKKIKLNLR